MSSIRDLRSSEISLPSLPKQVSEAGNSGQETVSQEIVPKEEQPGMDSNSNVQNKSPLNRLEALKTSFQGMKDRMSARLHQCHEKLTGLLKAFDKKIDDISKELKPLVDKAMDPNKHLSLKEFGTLTKDLFLKGAALGAEIGGAGGAGIGASYGALAGAAVGVMGAGVGATKGGVIGACIGGAAAGMAAIGMGVGDKVYNAVKEKGGSEISAAEVATVAAVNNAIAIAGSVVGAGIGGAIGGAGGAVATIAGGAAVGGMVGFVGGAAAGAAAGAVIGGIGYTVLGLIGIAFTRLKNKIMQSSQNPGTAECL